MPHDAALTALAAALGAEASPVLGPFAAGAQAHTAAALATLRRGGAYPRDATHLPRPHLENELAAFRAGDRPLCLLVGPSGCGKTHLLVVFAEQRGAEGDAVLWLDATRLAREHALSGDGLAAAVEARAGASLPPRTRIAAPRAPTVLIVVEAFDRVSGLTYSQPVLFGALQALVKARPGLRVVLPIREDTFRVRQRDLPHGVDPDGVCYRPRAAAGAPDDVAPHAVYVPRLPLTRAPALFDALADAHGIALRWATLPDPWRQVVREPFYARELVRHLAGGGALPSKTTGDAVIQARVDGLEPDDAAALRLLARELEGARGCEVVVSALPERAGPALAHLEVLEAGGFVVVEDVADQRCLRLAHDQLLGLQFEEEVRRGVRAVVRSTLTFPVGATALVTVAIAGAGWKSGYNALNVLVVSVIGGVLVSAAVLVPVLAITGLHQWLAHLHARRHLRRLVAAGRATWFLGIRARAIATAAEGHPAQYVLVASLPVSVGLVVAAIGTGNILYVPPAGLVASALSSGSFALGPLAALHRVTRGEPTEDRPRTLWLASEVLRIHAGWSFAPIVAILGGGLFSFVPMFWSGQTASGEPLAPDAHPWGSVLFLMCLLSGFLALPLVHAAHRAWLRRTYPAARP